MTISTPASNFRAVLKGLTILNGYSGAHALGLYQDPSLGHPRIEVTMGGITILPYHVEQMTKLGWRYIAAAGMWVFDDPSL